MDTTSDFLGHPKGLFVCFATEMWERFSYYGMRALLILYLTKHWEFSDAASYLIYGAYTSLVYIMPVFGGMLADQILGSKKAVTYGAILLVLGHTGMAFESSLQLFYFSLVDLFQVVLKNEFSNTSHLRGTVSMARTADPDSANSQFFICFDAAPHLDGQYTVFGQVIEGMEFVDGLKRGAPGSGTVDDPDEMVSVKVLADL